MKLENILDFNWIKSWTSLLIVISSSAILQIVFNLIEMMECFSNGNTAGSVNNSVPWTAFAKMSTSVLSHYKIITEFHLAIKKRPLDGINLRTGRTNKSVLGASNHRCQHLSSGFRIGLTKDIGMIGFVVEAERAPLVTQFTFMVDTSSYNDRGPAINVWCLFENVQKNEGLLTAYQAENYFGE